jgi:hypothetical protein
MTFRPVVLCCCLAVACDGFRLPADKSERTVLEDGAPGPRIELATREDALSIPDLVISFVVTASVAGRTLCEVPGVVENHLVREEVLHRLDDGTIVLGEPHNFRFCWLPPPGKGPWVAHEIDLKRNVIPPGGTEILKAIAAQR